MVHVFDLTGHPTASRAFAWSSPIEGSNEAAVLRGAASAAGDNPQAAVRGAIVAARTAQQEHL